MAPQQQPKLKWIDLSGYGMKMFMVRIPDMGDGNPGRVCVMMGGDHHEEKIKRLGFYRDRRTGLFLRLEKNAQTGKPELSRNPPDPREIKSLFPEATLIEDANPADYFRLLTPLGQPKHASKQEATTGEAQNPTGDAPVEEEVPIEVLLTQSRYLGLNRRGQAVFENLTGRFFRDQNGKAIFQRNLPNANPALFLRAPDAASLAGAAEGFVEEAVRGTTQRWDDLKRFATAVFEEDVEDTDPRLLQVYGAIEGAIARWLTQKGGASQRESFSGAMKAHEAMAFVGALARQHPATELPLPQPLAVALTRILGTETDLNGLDLVVNGSGAGALLSNLPKSAKIRAYEGDLNLTVHAKQTLATAGLPPNVLAEKPVDYTGHTVVANLRRSLLDAPRAMADGPTLTRADLVEAFESLAVRDPSGRSVFVIPGGSTPEEEAEIEAFRQWIARSYAIEGTLDVDGALHSGVPGRPAKRVLVVGRQRPAPLSEAPEAALRIREVHDWNSVWTWTAEVISNRVKIDEYHAVLDAADDDLLEGKSTNPELEQNTFQAPYVAMSSIGQATTMAPRYLESATREALTRAVRRNGDIDDLVCRELAFTRDQVAEKFSPEQIDSIALKIDAQNRGRAFMIADETGIGKGRQLAAIMRRAALQGKKVLFLTERAINLSDIWRDIMHIDSAGEFSPMVLNANTKIIDERTGEVMFRTPPKREIDHMLAHRVWPESVNLVLATYSQFSKKPDAEGGDKSAWLTAEGVVDDDTIVICDECHNVASTASNSAANVQVALSRTSDVTFSSATWLKKVRHMGVYLRLFPANTNAEELTNMVARNGESLQELLSAMLARDGVMIRREHDLSKCEFQMDLDVENRDRNRTMMDDLAPILSEIAYLAGDVTQNLNRQNDQLANEVRNELNNQRRRRANALIGAQAVAEQNERAARDHVRKFGMKQIGFGSPLYNVTRVFLAGLLVDKAANDAINALQNDEKPVILVDNTLTEILRELYEEFGDAENIVGQRAPDIKDVLNRMLDQMCRASRKDPTTDERITVDVTEGNPEMRDRVDAIRALIDRMPDLPVSSIDAIRDRIEKAGYSCDEITGRQYEFRDGRVQRRPTVDKTVIKNRYNAGALDCVIINQAGATGIDLHASRRFADQRRRVMIVAQPLPDITKQLQAYGRVNRFDQVTGPKIRILMAGLPIELRLMAMLNAKLRKLSANVTSNRNSASLLRDIPDLINSLGDVVCSRYAEARPDLMRRLGFDLERNARVMNENRQNRAEDEDQEDNRRSANEFLSRIACLPYAMQEQILDELTAEYEATYREMTANGTNPLLADEEQGNFVVRNRQVYEGADSEISTSVFNDPIYVEEVSIERQAKPLTSIDILEKIEEAQVEMISDGFDLSILADRLERNRESYMRTYMPANATSIEDAIAQGFTRVATENQKLDTMVNVIRGLQPGSEVNMTLDDQEERVIVTRIKPPKRGNEHLASHYQVEFARQGEPTTWWIPLSGLLNDENFRILDSQGLLGERREEVANLLDYMEDERGQLTPITEAVKRTKRLMLTGNVWEATKQAIEGKLGKLVVYNENGIRKRGVLVNKKKEKDLVTRPVRMESVEMAVAAVRDEKAHIYGTASFSSQGLVINKLRGEAGYAIALPAANSRKYNSIYEHPPVRALLERAEAFNKQHRLVVNEAELAVAIEHLMAAGAPLYISYKNREWANKWRTEQYEQMAANENGEPNLRIGAA